MVGKRMFIALMLILLIPAPALSRPLEDEYDDDDWFDDDDQSDELADVRGTNVAHEKIGGAAEEPQLEKPKQPVHDNKPTSGSEWKYKVAEGCKSADCKYKKCAMSPEDEHSCTATQYRDCSNETKERILTCANGMVFDGIGRSCSTKSKCESEPRRPKRR